MKKTFRLLFLAIAGIMISMQAGAQQMPPLPVDKDVRIGKLDNGLTYYIRHNEYPKGQADFYIAQKVGSILEEDNQRGLAHFLEHMCFNGTKNFPGNQVVSWLETVGVKFGQNLNAYTSIDETVYNISNVPTARESVQDSCLLILHDWACDLLLEPEEIDKERGVIHQEWRRSMVGEMRILENLLPIVFQGDRYGYRLPIGTMEVVDNFPYQALRDYYETWYRPDQQGIIVVGDIDVDRIEGKIKEMFSHIEMPANPKERIYYPVSDNKEPIYAVGRDKEQSNAVIEVLFKQDIFPDSLKNTMGYMAMDYITDMMSSMLDDRFDEISSKPDAPFAAAGAYYVKYLGIAKTKDAFTLTGVAKGNDIRPVLESVYRETLRAQRHGFTATEYERARSEYLSQLESQYKNRATRENGSYTREYVRHFIDNEPIPGIEYEYQVMSMVAKQIPVEVINEMIKQVASPDSNMVLLAMLPEKDDFYFPTSEDLQAVVEAVGAEDIEPYVDNVKTEPLITALPAPGTIVSETTDPVFGTTEWILSNGAKVVVKKTAFKDDEIRFSAVAMGGTSVVGDEHAASLIFMPVVLQQYGLGDFTNTDLTKYLAGKQVNLRLAFGDYERALNGQSTPKDIQTLMELIYKAFDNVNVTADEFEAMQNMYIGYLQNQEVDPQYIFQKNLFEALYTNPRNRTLDVETIKAADREVILSITKDMLANPADYTFAFVGNVDEAQLKVLVEQYIASIPGDAANKTDEVNFIGLGIKPGSLMDTFTAKMETPQTWVAIVATGNMPFTCKNGMVASMAGQILSARLIATVREKEGAVYSIGAQGRMLPNSENNVVMQLSFPMKPELKEKVLGMIRGEFDDMTKNITAEEFNKVKEFMVKYYIESLEKNDAWVRAIKTFQLNGVDTLTESVAVINSITEQDIKDFMVELMNQNNYHVVILDPEAAE